MAKTPKPPKRRNSERRAALASEWVWGSVALPAYVADGGEPYRPAVWILLELPEGLVVGHRVLAPDEPTSLSEFLESAMQHPMVGPARRPARLRVSTLEAAQQLREAFPTLEVSVAPTPEITSFEQELRRSPPGDAREHAPASYLERGRISPRLIEDLFTAAGPLYLTKPWNALADGDVMRFDCESLGVEGACVSIMGNAGQSFGFGLFPSLTAFEAFCAAAERASQRRHEPSSMDAGTSYLALHFEPAATLPPGLRREAAKYRWPVANVKAYPWPQAVDVDGVSRPLTPADLKLLTACALGLTAFFAQHGEELAKSDDYEAIGESYSNDLTGRVRLALPYECFDEFEWDDDDLDDDLDTKDGEGADLEASQDQTPNSSG